VPDQSRLDAKYFIDTKVYNCPFCNRRHVVYGITRVHQFDWTDAKVCHAIFVKCASCERESIHFTFDDITHYISGTPRFNPNIQPDDHIFFSIPTSFHVVDSRIPRLLRELIAEAEGCLKSNFLTGASACTRKIVYELAREQGAEGEHYKDRIKSLKEKLPGVEPTYFDALLTIQQVTSEKVHERSYDGWESKHLRLILAALSNVLNDIYVVPAIREEQRKSLLKLKEEVLGQKKQGED